jgi:glyoxylase-like metal-dependent hydrolase (beta-lactamase superfamily II)
MNPRTRTHKRREPAPGVFRLVLPLPFPGLQHVNAYLLASDEGDMLVDCGIWDPQREEGGWPELATALDATGSTVDRLASLTITHPHIDHYGMAGRVVDQPASQGNPMLSMHALAHDEIHAYKDPEKAAKRAREILPRHGVSPEEAAELTSFEDWRAFAYSFVEADTMIADGDELEVGRRLWEVVHTPGHDPAHVCLWAPEDRILISGDTLLGSITPHIDFRIGDEDPLAEFLESLERIERLDPALVLPGHGRPFAEGADRARAIARHHDRRLGAITQVVRSEARTASEITDAIFGNELLIFERRLALGEAFAHLAYLRRHGEIERLQRDDGTYVYRKVSRGPRRETA